SLRIAGEDAFAIDDPALPGGFPAFADDLSYGVVVARAMLGGGVEVGAKVQVDPDPLAIARAGIGTRFERDRYVAELDYFYQSANPLAGASEDLHEIGAGLGVPIADYWTLNASGYWDIAANTWLQAGGGLQYDDGYLEFGAD